MTLAAPVEMMTTQGIVGVVCALLVLAVFIAATVWL